MTWTDLNGALRNFAGVAKRYGVTLPGIGFWEMRAKRRIWRIKRGIMQENPRSWLMVTSWLIECGGVLIGEAGLKGPPAARYTVEIGYSTLSGFRNKGYMTEAVGALTRFAFMQRDYHVEKVTALTLPDNIASHRVLQKNGYTRQPSYGRYWLWERIKTPEDTDIFLQGEQRL